MRYGWTCCNNDEDWGALMRSFQGWGKASSIPASPAAVQGEILGTQFGHNIMMEMEPLSRDCYYF